MDWKIDNITILVQHNYNRKKKICKSAIFDY